MTVLENAPPLSVSAPVFSCGFGDGFGDGDGYGDGDGSGSGDGDREQLRRRRLGSGDGYRKRLRRRLQPTATATGTATATAWVSDSDDVVGDDVDRVLIKNPTSKQRVNMTFHNLCRKMARQKVLPADCGTVPAISGGYVKITDFGTVKDRCPISPKIGYLARHSSRDASGIGAFLHQAWQVRCYLPSQSWARYQWDPDFIGPKGW